MDAINENLFRVMSDAKNSKSNLEIEVGQKGITFHFERRNHVQSGTKQ
jgi:hypothetical protein